MLDISFRPSEHLDVMHITSLIGESATVIRVLSKSPFELIPLAFSFTSALSISAMRREIDDALMRDDTLYTNSQADRILYCVNTRNTYKAQDPLNV
jgi:hypothetical protein